jgi:hypothetical protein
MSPGQTFTPPQIWGVLRCLGTYKDRPRRRIDKGDPGNIFPSANQAQPAQVDPRQPRLEFTAAGQQEVDARPDDAGLVLSGIGECGRATSNHLRRRALRKAVCRNCK